MNGDPDPETSGRRPSDERDDASVGRRTLLRAAGGGTAGAAGVASAGSAAARAPDNPNVLLVNLDDAGRFFGSYHDWMDTPRMDALARWGTRFTNAHCPGHLCSPNRASLATGRYPHSHGQTYLDNSTPMHASETHYVELLADNGYTNYQYGKFHISRHDGDGGIDEEPRDFGFETDHITGHVPRVASEAIEDIRNGEIREPYYMEIDTLQPHRWNYYDGNPYLPREYDLSDEPVEVPGYLPDSQVVRRELREFRKAVELVDNAVSGIIRALHRQGLYDEDTLVIITSDGGIGMPRAKPTVYNSNTEVGLIVRWPGGNVPGRTTRDQMVSNMDIAPTILEAAGVSVPNDVQARSLLPAARGDDRYQARDAVFAERPGVRAVRTDSHKYIRRFGNLGKLYYETRKETPTYQHHSSYFQRTFDLDRRELYNIRVDPHEIRNRADESGFDWVRDGLVDRLTSWMERTNDPLRDDL